MTLLLFNKSLSNSIVLIINVTDCFLQVIVSKLEGVGVQMFLGLYFCALIGAGVKFFVSASSLELTTIHDVHY